MNFFLGTLADNLAVHILVSPHPAINPTDLAVFAESKRWQIVFEPVAKLLPLADYFVASSSTTIKWAFALGIPAIDYDMFSYGYKPLFPEHFIARDRKTFIHQVRALTQQPGLSPDLRDYCGRIDGKSVERILPFMLPAVSGSVMLISETPPQHKELITLAVDLATHKCAHIIFCTLNPSTLHDDHRARLADTGVEICEIKFEPQETFLKKIKYHLKKMRTLVYIIKKIYRFCFFLNYILFLLHYIHNRLYTIPKQKEIEHFFNVYNPSCIVAPEVTVHSDFIFYAYEAQKRRIPVIMYPFALCGKREFIEVFKDNPGHHIETKTMIPAKWIEEIEGKFVSILPPRRLIQLLNMKINPKYPWLIPCDYVDIVCVPSNFYQDYYIRDGVPNNIFKITGSYIDDFLFNSMEIYKKSANFSNNICIICTIPPCNNYRFDCAGVISYEEIIEKFCLPLLNLNADLRFLPHPSAPIKDLEIVRKYGIPISKGSTEQNIIGTDLMVTYGSTTALWAAMCGIPVLNYDVYCYHYDDYYPLASIKHVYSQDDYEQTLNKFCGNPEERRNWTKQASTVRSYVSMQDGNSGKRIRNLIQGLIRLNGRTAP